VHVLNNAKLPSALFLLAIYSSRAPVHSWAEEFALYYFVLSSGSF
jgi:hypothetical protein